VPLDIYFSNLKGLVPLNLKIASRRLNKLLFRLDQLLWQPLQISVVASCHNGNHRHSAAPHTYYSGMWRDASNGVKS
jgi:hypothetical protein